MIKIDKDRSNGFKLFIDEMESLANIEFHSNRGAFAVSLDDPSTIDNLLNHEFRELIIIYSLSFPISSVWSDTLKEVNILYKLDSYDISFKFLGTLQDWGYKEKYFYHYNSLYKSISDFNVKNVVGRDFTKVNLTIRISSIEKREYGFEVVFNVKKLQLSLKDEVEQYLNILYQLHVEALKLINHGFSDNTIVCFFNFPLRIQIQCEQYLLYFAQFLQDIGINATSNLKEKVGKVLFSVTPTDDIEGLDKIRKALAVYLSLPSSPVIYNDSFQSMQLKQQVENLQHSQRMKEMEMRSAQYALRLAQQNIENQDKIITRQNSFIDNQNKIIEKITSKSIMIDSLENKEELEKFCEGFEVGKSEFLIKNFGLHLNPATILKSAGKKILGKEDDKSVLGLNEEAEKENN